MIIRMVDVQSWGGWRNDRLRRIWKAAVKYWEEGLVPITVKPFPNPGFLSHGWCLDRIWEEEARDISHRVVVMTEQDFLPNLDEVELLLEGWGPAAAVAPVRQRANKGDTCPCFVALNTGHKHICANRGTGRTSLRSLKWEHPRDPAADLHEQISVDRFRGELMSVAGGWRYRVGEHLLYQRHLNSPLDMPLPNDILVKDVLEEHDKAVIEWLERQPPEYKGIYKRLLNQEARKEAGNESE